MFCINCGNEIPDNCNSCSGCGFKQNIINNGTGIGGNKKPQEVTINYGIHERHGFTTFYLYFSLIGLIYTGIRFLWVNSVFLSAGFFSLHLYLIHLIPVVVGVIGVISLLKWKKYGFWMYVGIRISNIFLPIIFVLPNANNMARIFLQAVSILIMWAVLSTKKNGKNTWEQLK